MLTKAAERRAEKQAKRRKVYWTDADYEEDSETELVQPVLYAEEDNFEDLNPEELSDADEQEEAKEEEKLGRPRAGDGRRRSRWRGNE